MQLSWVWRQISANIAVCANTWGWTLVFVCQCVGVWVCVAKSKISVKMSANTVASLDLGLCGLDACVLHYPTCPLPQTPPLTPLPIPVSVPPPVAQSGIWIDTCFVACFVSPFPLCTHSLPDVCGLVVVIQQADRLNTPQGQAHTQTQPFKGCWKKSVTKIWRKHRGNWGNWGQPATETRSATLLGTRRIQTNNNHATIVRAANKLLSYVYMCV